MSFSVESSSPKSDLDKSTEFKMLELHYTLKITVKRRYTLHRQGSSGEGKIIVYREYFLRLLSTPKPLRDQLIIELPTLNAFRTQEVATIEVEHVDLDRGDIQVLDSKKHKLFTVPLDYTVARHIETFLTETKITSGFVFTRTSRAGRSREGHITDQAIEYYWKKWCRKCGIPEMPPRYGRAYFAVEWHIVKRKSLIGLMDVLRHTNLAVTQKYLSKIRSYADTKNEFYQGMNVPFLSECARADFCPLATEGCHCRMFTPKIEVETK